MTAPVESMIAVTYVKNIDASRSFYELLGFREHSHGESGSSAWSVMRCGQVSVLLAMTGPTPKVPPLPMLSYLFYADLGAVLSALGDAGVAVTRTGHPPHALGGEATVLDPDGNTVLLGQRGRQGAEAPADDEGRGGFSVLKEAAALVAARGGAPSACEITGRDGRACRNPAEVKLADSSGDGAWSCLAHAEEVLMTVAGTFIASHDGQGIAAFLAARQPHP
jgi:catechol 2,3-dioxygenase-like lactoylglutathione lyase family enzyme